LRVLWSKSNGSSTHFRLSRAAVVAGLCQAVQGTAATHDAGIMVIREIAVVLEHRHVECGEGRGMRGDKGMVIAVVIMVIM
jgi:hypothetical protein